MVDEPIIHKIRRDLTLHPLRTTSQAHKIMKRLKTLKEAISAVGVPVSALVGKQGEEYLANRTLPSPLRFVLVFLLILVVYIGIRRAAGWLLTLRSLRRLVVRSQFVEGTWMDVVRLRGEVAYVGVLRFSVEEERLRITGENYTVDCVLENSFNSDMVDLDWPVVTFTYSADREVAGNAESQGFSRIRFAERDGPPCRYKGFYQDTNGRRADYIGWRITNSDELAAIDDPLKIREVIRAVVKRENRGPEGMVK